jgi:hypothetical protein
VFLKRQAELEDRDRLLPDYWQRNVPWIARLYELKEQFFDIYEASSRAEAEDRLHSWLVGIPEELESWFQPILTHTTTWREEILNYFDHPYTNAGTEALNGLVKLANRNGRGYSFDVLRRRFIYHPRLQREVWRSTGAQAGWRQRTGSGMRPTAWTPTNWRGSRGSQQRTFQHWPRFFAGPHGTRDSR